MMRCRKGGIHSTCEEEWDHSHYTIVTVGHKRLDPKSLIINLPEIPMVYGSWASKGHLSELPMQPLVSLQLIPQRPEEAVSVPRDLLKVEVEGKNI